MFTFHEQLQIRRTRALFQILITAFLVGAVGLAAVEHAGARAVSAGLLGVLLLVVLKLTLITFCASQFSSEVAAEPPVAELTSTEPHMADSPEDPTALVSLVRRLEDAIAETVVLRHEVTYLRETIELLHRDGT